MLRFSMFIEQSCSHNPSKDVASYNLASFLVTSYLASIRTVKRWKIKTLTLVIILRVIELMKIISTIVCNRDGCKLVLPLFAGWLNGRRSRHIYFVKEIVLQETTPNTFWFLEKNIFICHTCYNEIHPKYFIYKKPLGLSHVWRNIVDSIKWCIVVYYETDFQKDDRGLFQCPVLPIHPYFPEH